ncbi:MAG: phosphopantetheine-binding protein [Panacagrimonas sp.]
MSVASAAERELAQLLVAALNLESVDPDTIDPEAPLMGHEAGGLGLDSIDALEIALTVEQNHGVELRTDDENITQIFGSLRALSAHVQTHRKK